MRVGYVIKIENSNTKTQYVSKNTRVLTDDISNSHIYDSFKNAKKRGRDMIQHGQSGMILIEKVSISVTELETMLKIENSATLTAILDALE